MSIISNDIVLWRILAITGLDFINYRLRHTVREKCFHILFIIGFFVTLTYLVAVALSSVWKHGYKESLLYVLSPINSGLLWYFAYSRKRAISNVVMETYRYR